MLSSFWREAWPLVNVGIVTVHILILLRGLWLIKIARDPVRHPRVMILAGVVFLVFLASFVTRIAILGPAPLGVWPGPLQPAHLQAAHAGIALVTVGMVATTYWAGLTRRFDLHRKIAPWAFALWVFTGLFGILGHFVYPRP